MTIRELQKKIDLYQEIMDGCLDKENSYTLVDAMRGKKMTQKYIDFQTLVKKGGLEKGFFDVGDPLIARAKRKRDIYVSLMDEKLLLRNGISIA